MHLELGYLYQELGDFARARDEYDEVTRSDSTDSFARAARLNRANIDVESGAVDRARAEYDALLTLDLSDTAVRHSRALLELRLGQAASAEKDLSAPAGDGLYLEASRRDPGRAGTGPAPGGPHRRGARWTRPRRAGSTLARPTSGSGSARCWPTDASTSSSSTGPTPSPCLPIGGQRLHADLRAAADGLARLASGQDQGAFRATLTRAVILAALGEQSEAVAAASRAIALSPYSSYAT